MSESDYPAGAFYDDDAPWNQIDDEPNTETMKLIIELEMDDVSKETIVDHLKQHVITMLESGFIEGELCEDDEHRGWWTLKIEEDD